MDNIDNSTNNEHATRKRAIHGLFQTRAYSPLKATGKDYTATLSPKIPGHRKYIWFIINSIVSNRQALLDLSLK